MHRRHELVEARVQGSANAEEECAMEARVAGKNQ